MSTLSIQIYSKKTSELISEFKGLIVTAMNLTYSVNIASSYNQGIRTLATNTYVNPVTANIGFEVLTCDIAELEIFLFRCLSSNQQTFQSYLSFSNNSGSNVFSKSFTLSEYNIGRPDKEYRATSSMAIIFLEKSIRFSSLLRGIANNVIRS